MKLKKIASLALAGVMAVSMLAGCANKTEDKTENNQTVAATVADYANSLLSDAQKNVFQYKDSADLTAALQKVAGDSEKFTSTKIAGYANSYKELPVAELSSALKDEMDYDYDAFVSTENKGLANNNTKGTKSEVWVYGVSGKLEQDTAVQLVMNYFVGATMKDASYFPAAKGNLKNDYTAEISAVKVTSPDDSTVSMWAVAIVVTQTATEVQN